MGRRFCPICVEEGRKSTMMVYERTRTAMGSTSAYWDEDGVYHPPVDPNKTTTKYVCSNGHSWTETE